LIRAASASLKSLTQTLGGEMILAHDAEQERDLILMIGAMGLDSSRNGWSNAREKLAVVVGDRWDIQNLAIRVGVKVLIVTGGLGVEKKTVEAARKNKVNLISSPHDTATTAALCRASIAIRHVVNEEFLALNEDASLEEVRARAAASGFAAFPVLDAQGRTAGVLAKTDFLKPVERKLILVDHNELSQAVQGADQVEILEIIDHHRIGTLTTQQPILFRNEPVGSTSTIVADCFFRYDVELPSPIAGLLLAGIIADTLNLTSPTTTVVDGEILRRLEQISGVKARDFTEKLFASGSLLTLKPAPKAITTDCKEYKEDGVRFSVAQIEELGFDQFWKRKVELQAALEAYCTSRKYQFSALLVTDVTPISLMMAGDANHREH
jgi:manganese-dependent inorganic pyrophosphatase